LPKPASPRQASCVNGWFAGNAKIKAKLPKFVMAVPDCSQAMSSFQKRPITVLFAEAGTDRDTHHIPAGESRFPNRAPCCLGFAAREFDALLPMITLGGI
jgi:hypothetical protein